MVSGRPEISPKTFVLIIGNPQKGLNNAGDVWCMWCPTEDAQSVERYKNLWWGTYKVTTKRPSPDIYIVVDGRVDYGIASGRILKTRVKDAVDGPAASTRSKSEQRRTSLLLASTPCRGQVRLLIKCRPIL